MIYTNFSYDLNFFQFFLMNLSCSTIKLSPTLFFKIVPEPIIQFLPIFKPSFTTTPDPINVFFPTSIPPFNIHPVDM